MIFDWQPTLIGPTLRLRPMVPEDFDALYGVASDPLIWAGHPATNRSERDIFRQFFDTKMASGGPLVVEHQPDGRIIGMSRFSLDGTEPGEVEIGSTFLARSHWGGGSNAEMKALMLDHAFRYADRVIFLIGENNLRSRRAIEKMGASLLDRRFPAQLMGVTVSHVVYAIDRSVR